MAPGVVVIDGTAGILPAVGEAFRPGWEIGLATGGREALDLLSRERTDLVLLNPRLVDMPGAALAREITARHPFLPLVVISNVTDTDNVSSLVRAGAADFLVTPLETDELRTLAIREAADAGIRRETPPGDGLWGVSAAMRRLRRALAAAARDGGSVVLHAGKGLRLENTARYMARFAGPRVMHYTFRAEEDAHGLLALPPHVRGVVYFPMTNDNLPAVVEALAALRERRARDGDSLQFVLDASAAGPGAARDLPWPNLRPLAVPPLDQRREDVPHYLHHFVRAHARRLRRDVRALAPEALDLLLLHGWPGNVKEIDETMETLVERAPGPVIQERTLLELRAGAFADWLKQRAGQARLAWVHAHGKSSTLCAS